MTEGRGVYVIRCVHGLDGISRGNILYAHSCIATHNIKLDETSWTYSNHRKSSTILSIEYIVDILDKIDI